MLRKKILVVSKVWIGTAALLVSGGCQEYMDTNQVTGTVSSVSLGSLTTTGDSTSITFTPPSGSGYSSLTIALGNFQASSICNGTTTLGLPGTASCAVSGSSLVVSLNFLLASNANRDILTTPLTQIQEVTTYAGVPLPTTGGYSYRDYAKIASDDEGGYLIGYCSATPVITTQAACLALGGTYQWVGNSMCVDPASNTAASCTGGAHSWVQNGGACANTGTNTDTCSTSYPISTAMHNAYVDCGGSGFSSISAAIADCANASKNGLLTTWNGGALGGHGESNWVMVAHKGGAGSNAEVWQDQRTGLLWSSKSSSTSVWCGAAGNTDTWSTTSCAANTTSYCQEASGMTPGLGGDTGGAWQNTGRTYDNLKGGMGAQSTPPVQWRPPTKSDYNQAEIDGIRFVMPDMGFGSGTEWTASTLASTRSVAWYFNTVTGLSSNNVRTGVRSVRCVGH